MPNNKDEVRESIKDLLQDDGTNLPIANTGDLPSFHSMETFSYDTTKTAAVENAKKMMSTVMKLYLSEKIIEENEYVQMKQRVEEMQLATLLNQMQQMQHSIEVLMRTIETGELSPRMFEVLGGLQKTMLEINKHTTLHIMASEENAKKLKHDIDIYGDNKELSQSKKIDGVVSRGNRDFMKDIQEEIQDVDFDNEEQKDGE